MQLPTGKRKLLAVSAAALTLVGGTAAYACGGTTNASLVKGAQAVEGADESPSPTPTPTPTETATPSPSPIPSESPTPEVTASPQGNAYGWWRNRGVMKDKPGNGPKAKHHNGDEDHEGDES